MDADVILYSYYKAVVLRRPRQNFPRCEDPKQGLLEWLISEVGQPG